MKYILLLQTVSWCLSICRWRRCGLTFLSNNVGKAWWLPRVLTVAPRTRQVKWLNRNILAAAVSGCTLLSFTGNITTCIGCGSIWKGIPSLSLFLPLCILIAWSHFSLYCFPLFLPLSSLFPCLIVHNSSSPLLFHSPFDSELSSWNHRCSSSLLKATGTGPSALFVSKELSSLWRGNGGKPTGPRPIMGMCPY